jgi:hypothetical protein
LEVESGAELGVARYSGSRAEWEVESGAELGEDPDADVDAAADADADEAASLVTWECPFATLHPSQASFHSRANSTQSFGAERKPVIQAGWL